MSRELIKDLIRQLQSGKSVSKRSTGSQEIEIETTRLTFRRFINEEGQTFASVVSNQTYKQQRCLQLFEEMIHVAGMSAYLGFDLCVDHYESFHDNEGRLLSARRIADCCLLENQSLLFYGAAGTRKTSLALAITREGAERHHLRPFITSWSLLKNRIRNCRNWSFQVERIEDIYREIRKSDLVFIDEIGMGNIGNVSDEDRQIFFDLLCQIEGLGKRFLMTSNRSLEEIRDHFGPEICGRLTHQSHVMTKCFDHEMDYRQGEPEMSGKQ